MATDGTRATHHATVGGPTAQPTPPAPYPQGAEPFTDPADLHRYAEELRRLRGDNGDLEQPRPFGILYTRSMLEHIPPPETIYGPYIIRGGVNMLYGKWGTAKSFLLLSWAAHLATGTPWNGHTTKEPENVLYWAAEGQGGLHPRLTAWEQHHGVTIPDTAFIVPQKSPALDRDQTFDALSEVIDRTKARHLFIDTLIRVKGALRENEADELGGYLLTELAHRICREHDVSVTLAHHVGHEAKDRPRGSSSIADNLDGLYEIRDAGVGIKTLQVRKLKDQPSETTPDNFRLLPIGDSAVLIPTEDIPLTESGQEVLRALEEASRNGEWVSQTNLSGMAGVHRNTVATQLKALVGTKVDYRHRSGRSAEYRLIRRTDATQPDLHKDPIVQVPDDLPDPW